MKPSALEILSTYFFAIALIHTFSAAAIQRLAQKYKLKSTKGQLLHLFSRLELIFGIWAIALLIVMLFFKGFQGTRAYIEGLNFNEPLFVLTIMLISASRPVIQFATRVIFFFSRVLPFEKEVALYVSCLTLGPLLGSFITEPAAMTVTALILRQLYFSKPISEKLKYGTLAVLFVNISVGGVLTHFAAPPVLMVAYKWNWDLAYMFNNFGWKALLAVSLNALAAGHVFKSELGLLKMDNEPVIPKSSKMLIAAHLCFLIAVVVFAQQPIAFLALLAWFFGLFAITLKHQDELLLRQSVGAAFFLAGLVVLGTLQSWWLAPLIISLQSFALFFGATLLTPLVNSSALTSLASQFEPINEGYKYALVSGAVAGGGLSVIANIPNLSGYLILKDSIDKGRMTPSFLLLAALIPTLISMACFWLPLG